MLPQHRPGALCTGQLTALENRVILLEAKSDFLKSNAINLAPML